MDKKRFKKTHPSHKRNSDMQRDPSQLLSLTYNKKVNTKRHSSFPLLYAGASLVQIQDMLHILGYLCRKKQKLR